MNDELETLLEKPSNKEQLVYIRKVLFMRTIQIGLSNLLAAFMLMDKTINDFFDGKIWLAILLKFLLVPVLWALFKYDKIAGNKWLSWLMAFIATFLLGALLGSIFPTFGKRPGTIVIIALTAVHIVLLLYSLLEYKKYSIFRCILSVLAFEIATILTIYFIEPGNILLNIFCPLFTCVYGCFMAWHSENIANGKIRPVIKGRWAIAVMSVYVDFTLIKFYIAKFIVSLCKKKKSEQPKDKI